MQANRKADRYPKKKRLCRRSGNGICMDVRLEKLYRRPRCTKPKLCPYYEERDK